MKIIEIIIYFFISLFISLYYMVNIFVIEATQAIDANELSKYALSVIGSVITTVLLRWLSLKVPKHFKNKKHGKEKIKSREEGCKD